MDLQPRFLDKLALAQLGFLAQRRLARGLQLNMTETKALLSSVLHELVRDGTHSVADLMSLGKHILGRRHVLPHIPSLLHDIQIEGTFNDGVFLVTVHEPICSDEGDIQNALYGSFLPIPSPDLFPLLKEEEKPLPGAVIVRKERIYINQGRSRAVLSVTNLGDRPIQVGSHFHFIESNRSLRFDRGKAYGKRLDIPAGTAVRFEPGETQTVQLTSIAGRRVITGGNSLATGVYDASRTDAIIAELIQKGFAHVPQPSSPAPSDKWLSRDSYASMFGPTIGDRIRLGDTSLWIEIQRDFTVYGDECKFGGGKVLREGQGQATAPQPAALDLLITNAIVVDALTGIVKADVGVRDGRIVAVGKAGNPDVMDGVHPELVVGGRTEVIAGEKLILTAGAIDAHVHYICPQQVEEALASGTTTMVGGGTGPAAGTNATTCTPSPFYILHMLRSTDDLPMNFAFTGKGNDASREASEDIVRAGAAGLKLHEDWGTTPAAIRCALDVGDAFDVQVNIHTDTLNEAGFVEDSINAFGGRTIHTYHTEGAGGGHAPDIITVCSLPHVLPSSTNPTRPYARNTLDEHLDMLMVCHHLDKSIPEDLAFAESRIRGETVAAEDVLHDLGAISIISSDSQAMGRVGEVIARTWRTASKMRDLRGPLASLGDVADGNDNARVLRYIAKYTVNPARAHGFSHVLGSVAAGQIADLVLWAPETFGVRPEMVLKSGVIAWSQMGDANASIPTVQPSYGKPMWGARAGSVAENSVAFVSQISLDNGTIESYGLRKRAIGVKGCRSVKKADMVYNDATPHVEVDPETYVVKVDGVHATVPPADWVPLAKNYNVF